jgi:P-type Cu+ transporter
MTGTEIIVTTAGAAAIGALALFFFGPKTASRAKVDGGVQEVEVTVKGGYSPSLIHVQEGMPVRFVFDRQETGECSSRVLFPDFGVSKSLPAFGRTTLEFVPTKTGTFGFACGMNMLHGTLIVEPEGAAAATVRDSREVIGTIQGHGAGQPLSFDFVDPDVKVK